MTVDADTVAGRLADVRSRIAAAGGDPSAVTVIAVTKGFGPDAVAAAAGAGLADVGENYAQELVAKHDQVHGTVGPTMRWHFLGPVQRNKVKALAPRVALWQAVDREAAGGAIAAHGPGSAALVQVNTDGAPGRSGCRPSEVAALVECLVAQGLQVRGLMTIGPVGPPELARPVFAAVTVLADRLGLAVRSMGMTADLEVAVQEGSTMVRVGRALFGPRPTGSDLRR
jgi:pyridoxal phosphate enzyme (YggS family)